MKLSAVILTKNEEKNIGECLKSVGFADEIIVVDDYSTDKTVETVHKSLRDRKVYKVFQRKLNGDFAAQRNYGLSQSSGDWIIFLDADERLNGNLVRELSSLIQNPQSEEDSRDAYYIRRRDFFWGREMKYGETKKTRDKGILRLVRKGTGLWLGNVHEVFHTAKNCGSLKYFIDHYPHPDIKSFLKDINFYSTIRANELYNRGKKSGFLEIVFYPFGKFIYTYVILLGFLDGPAGFCYSFMMSFHSFLVRAKLYQLRMK